MRNIKIKAVILTDGKDYIIHGTNGEDAPEMFRKMTTGVNPLWIFNPATDASHFVEVDVTVPEYEILPELELEIEVADTRMELTLDDIKNSE